MKKKIALLLMATMSLGAITTGCGEKTEDGMTADGKIEIRFATWDTADDVEFQQGLVNSFNESQDEIEVVLEAYGSDYDTKINAGMGAKDAPDVMYMWNYPSYHGGLEPLNKYMEEEGDEYLNNFYQATLDYNSLNGEVYGIPVGFTTHALYYNKDIFAQAGVAEPTGDWTWDDLEAAATEITEKVDGVKGFSFSMKPDAYDYEMFFWSNGTAFMDEEGNVDGYINSPEAVEVIENFQGMVSDEIAIATEGSGTDEFRAGSTAMYTYGIWGMSALEKDGMNYGVSTIPAFEGKEPVSIVNSSGVSISKDSLHKDAAWEFVKYWTSEALNIERLDTELSPLKSVVESQGVSEDPRYIPFYTALEGSAGYVPSSYISKEWSNVSETLKLTFERAYNPSTQEDPTTILNEAVEELK